MASFSAQLLVVGHCYPVRQCTYEFTQTVGPRGRVTERVRTGLVQLTLDVPPDDFLPGWATTPNQPLAGQVVFFAAQGGSALETLGWEVGQCVGYQEEFAAGDQETGAYSCHLTVAASKLTIRPGGPLADSSLGGMEPGTIQAYAGDLLGSAFLTPGVAAVVAEAAPVFESLVLPTVEQLAAAAAKRLLVGAAGAAAAAAAPVALTIGLVVSSITPTAANDTLPQTHLLPIDPDKSRLQVLEAAQAAGNLTGDEELELLALLGKVRGVHLTAADLVVYYLQRPAELALVAKLKPPAEYHSINTLTSESYFGGGNRNTAKTIAKGHIDLQADFAEIQAGNMVYDKQAQTFKTVAGRIYGFHPDHITSKGTSPIYPIAGNPGDFVNVTQAEFRVLQMMLKNQGIQGPPLRALQGLLRSGNPGVDATTEAKLVDLFSSRQP